MNSNPASSSVSVIDASSNDVIDIIRTGRGPMHMAIDARTKFAYITDTGDNTKKSVTIVDLADNSVKAKIRFKSIEPFETVIVPEKQSMYTVVSGGYFVSDDNNISVIDTDTNKIVRTLPVGKNPWYVAVDAPSDRIYITCAGDNSVTVIDTKHHVVIGAIQVGKSPRGIAIDSEFKKAYVADKLDHTVSVIDLTSNRVTRTIRLEKNAHPWGIAVY